ncbi:MAG: lipid A biosynthesis lauroyl acyltransferase [Rhizobiaceae bacterium]|nr:lipid A biosynthesis lauroyl acyltransferase [Rhizobiaceae bacterium]
MEKIIRKTIIALRNFRDWTIAQWFFSFMWFLKLFPADTAINTTEKFGRFLGMKFSRTKVARKNLKLSFPQKSDDEIEQILSDMWGNLSRTAAEYAYLDKIFDFDDNNPTEGRFEIAGVENFRKLLETKGTAICFTAHTGNWELLPVGSAAYGVNITALFRAPNNRYIAERVMAARTTGSGHLVPSKAGAAWALAGLMDEGKKVGLLVDQYYAGKGVPIEFFGRKTKANPLLAKLVRQYDCPVFPARTIRLPGGRFRLEVQPPLDIPRNKEGDIDTRALTQKVSDVVEEWVREYPEQWLWLHKRWR